MAIYNLDLGILNMPGLVEAKISTTAGHSEFVTSENINFAECVFEHSNPSIGRFVPATFVPVGTYFLRVMNDKLNIEALMMMGGNVYFRDSGNTRGFGMFANSGPSSFSSTMDGEFGASATGATVTGFFAPAGLDIGTPVTSASYRVPTVSQYGTFSMGILDTPDAPTSGDAVRVDNATPVVGFVVRTSDGKEWIKSGTGDFDFTEVPATISGLSASGQAAFANLDKLRS